MRTWVWIFLVSGLAVGLVAGLPAQGGAAVVDPANLSATPVRVADAACEQCHGEIFRGYVKTPMANASGLATEKLIPAKYLHAASGTEYSISEDKGVAELSFRGPAAKGMDGMRPPAVERPLNYYLGSGHLAVTYLYSLNGLLFESPVAWYSASNGVGAQAGYDMKPGFGDLKQTPPSIPMQSACLRCHMSGVQASGAGSINLYKNSKQDLPFLHTGITCEQCHGDAEQHVSSKGKAAIVNPRKLTAERRDSVCISCHLEGDVTVERAGKSALSYKPGEAISTYLAFYTYGGANLTTRGVSEVEQFAQSTCKRMSGEKMSCTTCHDPHLSPSAEERVAFYRGKCLACHTGVTFASKHHAENQDCTSCHMKPTGAENIPHVAWTDHRILKVPEDGASSAGVPVTGRELGPIFSPGATRRDLGMGYYKLMFDGNRALEPKARETLSPLESELHDDKDALDALGVLSLQRGDAGHAQRLFDRVLEIDPNDLIALTNLGTLLARQGKLKESVGMLKAAFERNPQLPALATNLARLECAAGDAAAARSALETTLVYNPDFPSVTKLLGQLSDCSGKAQGMRP